MVIHLPKTRRRPRRSRLERGAAYRRVLVALSPSAASARAVHVACEIAGGRDVDLGAVAVIEVPLDEPLQTPDADVEAAANAAVRTAEEVGAAYGIPVVGVLLRARDAGEAIVEEAVERDAQLVVLAVEFPTGRGRVRRLSPTTDHVLKHCPCRVLLIDDPAPATAGRPAWEPVFRMGPSSDYWPTGEFVDPGSTSR